MTNYPKVVYKYRGWKDDYHKKVLTENSLFFASPKQFNDPFDCRIPDNILSLNDDKLFEYANLKIHQHAEYLNPNRFNLDAEKTKLYERIKHNPKKFQEELEHSIFEHFDIHIGVLSLTAK